MSEEEKKTEQQLVMPDDEAVLEKFRGKSLLDVQASYVEAEKKMTEALQRAAALERQLQEAQAAKETPVTEELEEEEDLAEYEYVTKADIKKLLEEKSKPPVDPQELATQVANTVLGVMEAKNFGKEHQLDEETLGKVVNVAQALGAENIPDALTKLEELNKKLGYTKSAEVRTVPVPSNLEGLAQEDSGGEVPDRIKRMRAAAAKTKIKFK